MFVGDVGGLAAGVPLFQSDSEAVYVPPTSGSQPGDLIYVSNGRIAVRPFNATSAVPAGDARALDLQSSGPTLYQPSMLSASVNVMASALFPIPFGTRLGFVQRNGESLHLRPESEAQNWPRLSPDGQWLARQRIDPVRGNPDIWVENLARGTRIRVTVDRVADMLPVWSPTSDRIAYVSTDGPPRVPGRLALNIADRDGTGVVQTVPCPDVYCEPTDWSPDGKFLVVNVRGEKGADVWAIATDAGGVTRPLLSESYAERDARISPDGQWIAYVSEESGRPEVSVRDMSRANSRDVLSGGAATSRCGTGTRGMSCSSWILMVGCEASLSSRRVAGSGSLVRRSNSASRRSGSATSGLSTM